MSQSLPWRYRDNFRQVKVTRADGMWFYDWQCRRCGQQIKANTLGAQSHITKHVRQALKSPVEETTHGR